MLKVTPDFAVNGALQVLNAEHILISEPTSLSTTDKNVKITASYVAVGLAL